MIEEEKNLNQKKKLRKGHIQGNLSMRSFAKGSYETFHKKREETYAVNQGAIKVRKTKKGKVLKQWNSPVIPREERLLRKKEKEFPTMNIKNINISDLKARDI